MASLTYENGSLVYQSSYHPGLVAALKAEIPDTDRRWDGSRKVWIVSPKHGDALATLTLRYGQGIIHVPTAPAAVTKPEIRILEVRYLGATKDRGADDRSAYGFVGGNWSVVFPEKVLRTWFSAEAPPDKAPTLYAVLGVDRKVTAADLRKAYFRLAKQWHPDVTSEPNAKEMFQRLQHAYSILSDNGQRAKYDAGLALEATLQKQTRGRWADMVLGKVPQGSGYQSPDSGYRSPLRCGLIMCEGIEQLGRFVIGKILAWEDVVRADGKVLSTSWSVDSDFFVESWL